jgi:hypothetical protein
MGMIDIPIKIQDSYSILLLDLSFNYTYICRESPKMRPPQEEHTDLRVGGGCIPWGQKEHNAA